MKCIKTIGILLLFALLASTAAATTENKEMPTEKEVTAFIDNFKAPDSGDFANSAYDAFIEQFPAGHCDVWSNGMISLYFYDPDSSKEYGAIYLDSIGKEVKTKCGTEITCVKSYKGEDKTEVKENTKEDDKKVSEDKEDVKEEAVTDKEDVKEEVKEETPKEVPETTENKDLPTENEVTNFINNFKASGDFANSAYDAFIEKYPAGHCDLWSNGVISLYYYAPDSSKGYGAIYLDNTGKEVKPSCGAGVTCVKSYKGNEKTEVKADTKEDNQKVTEDQNVPEVKEENNTSTEIKEDTPAVKESSDDKIQSVIKFFKTGDMGAESLEKCLYHYFGED